MNAKTPTGEYRAKSKKEVKYAKKSTDGVGRLGGS